VETRSSNILVGAVVLALTVAMFAFVLWISRYSGETKHPYDILFKQSVSGLAVGSEVAFKGVPVGQIKSISLVPESPDLVRVRIEVSPDVPILQGVAATIEGVGFTGVSQIQLEGAMAGAKPITKPGPWGAPVIPAVAGGLGKLLDSAPELLNRISELSQHLNELLNPANQKAISGILANTNRLTGMLADRGPELSGAINDLQKTLKSATAAADAIEKLATDTNGVVNDDAKPMIADLRTTLGNANTTLAKINLAVDTAQPGIDHFSNGVAPNTDALLRELRETTAQLGALAAKLDEDPAGALVGGRRLPDYVPPKAK
jgi:phospholipid/cholesterol/gamma-HCH transport system substrate-binding protein